MSRPAFPFAADDISALARSLRAQLDEASHPPGHLELLNMLARAVGRRNFQHFRAQAVAEERLAQPMPQPPAPADHVRVARIARHFDVDGRLERWPNRDSHRRLCLWVLWSLLPGRDLSEKQVNAHLNGGHTFGDYALLRRWLCDLGMVIRTPDGRVYRRIEQPPPADARALIQHLKGRRLLDGAQGAVARNVLMVSGTETQADDRAGAGEPL